MILAPIATPPTYLARCGGHVVRGHPKEEERPMEDRLIVRLFLVGQR